MDHANGRVSRLPHRLVSAPIPGLWIDEFTDGLLASIASFFTREWDALASQIQHLSESTLMKDRNNCDKLYLLQARFYEAIKDVARCRRMYALLQHHPVFGPEAEEHL